jgi:cation diffusion facilitator family transporter
MNNLPVETYKHSHTFNQDKKRHGEARTLIVIIITASMMILEISTGIVLGSIALLADGLHMASHAAALTINMFAYIYARRHARNSSFSFGTGKVNALGGFTGAVLLAVFAIIMAWESVDRLFNPVEIAFNQAILVAIAGLIVNGVSVFILGENHDHEDDEAENLHHGNEKDHNLKAAYLHVLADALTSILAILALLAGKFLGLLWMDPMMGIIGAILVSKWSIGLIKTTSDVLLDKQGMEGVKRQIKNALESNGDAAVTDLHLWSIGPDIYCLIIAILAKFPRSPVYYKKQLPSELGLAHVTIEVNQIPDLDESQK